MSTASRTLPSWPGVASGWATPHTCLRDPGPNDGTTPPPTADLTSVNNGWIFVGGDPSACPGGGSPGNLLKVFSSSTAIVLDKSALAGSAEATVFLGLDVPVCDFSYNPDTDPVPTEAGWSKPTLVIGPADPRFPDDGEGNVTDPDCRQRLGLELKLQVVAIGVDGVGGGGGPPPADPFTVTSIITLSNDGNGAVDAATVVFSNAVDDSTVDPTDWTIGGRVADSVVTLAVPNDNTIQLRLGSANEVVPRPRT